MLGTTLRSGMRGNHSRVEAFFSKIKGERLQSQLASDW
jgi:hypothetical protein